MRETQPSPTRSNGARPEATDGRFRPDDRSHMLRRSIRSPLAAADDQGAIRIRRERRVNGSFSGIPALARNGRH